MHAAWGQCRSGQVISVLVLLSSLNNMHDNSALGVHMYQYQYSPCFRAKVSGKRIWLQLLHSAANLGKFVTASTGSACSGTDMRAVVLRQNCWSTMSGLGIQNAKT